MEALLLALALTAASEEATRRESLYPAEPEARAGAALAEAWRLHLQARLQVYGLEEQLGQWMGCKPDLALWLHGGGHRGQVLLGDYRRRLLGLVVSPPPARSGESGLGRRGPPPLARRGRLAPGALARAGSLRLRAAENAVIARRNGLSRPVESEHWKEPTLSGEPP